MDVYQSKWLKAKRELVKTEAGVKVDFSSGIFTSNLGHDNHLVKMAIIEQLNKGFTCTYQHPTEIRERYLAELETAFQAKAVLLFTTGAEACEAAYRIMREYSNKPTLALMKEGFHGKTRGVLQGAGNHFRINHPTGSCFIPKSLGVICGMMIEPYRPYDAAWYPLPWISKINNIANLICVDEVQAGFYRCGTLLASDHYHSIKKDLVVIGKSMGNGFPMSAVLIRRKQLADFVANRRDDYTSTFGGNPLACAAGSAALEQYLKLDTDELLKKSAAMKEELPEHNGCGFCFAIDCKDLTSERRVVKEIFAQGVIVIPTGKGWIKLAPPVTSRLEYLVYACKIIKRTVREQL